MRLYLLCALLIFMVSCAGQEKPASSNATTQPVSTGSPQPFFGHLVTSDSFHTQSPISAIYRDKSGVLWFATNGDGVFRFDGKLFTRYTVDDGLCSNFVFSASQDKNGKLWFQTRDGICRLDDTHFTWFTDNGLRRHETAYVPAPPVDTVYDWHSERGDAWFNGFAGPYRYDGSSFTYMPLPKSKYDYSHAPSPANQVSAYGLYCSFEDKDGNVWFGTQTMGVCRFDGKSFTWFADKDLSGPAVRAIFQDKQGNMWFGNNGGGVIRYDGNTLTNFTEEHNLGNERFLRSHIALDLPGSLARVFAITDDDRGRIWFGTADAGVWRFDPSADATHALVNFSTANGLDNNGVIAICNDKAGGVLIGTNSGSVYQFNGTSFVKYYGAPRN